MQGTGAVEQGSQAHRLATAELRQLDQHPGAVSLRAGWRAQERWEQRWANAYEGFIKLQDQRVLRNLDEVVAPLLHKAEGDTPPPEQQAAGPVIEALGAQVAADQFQQGAMAVYLGLGVDTTQEAGQFTLDVLGLNKTFAWASQRDFVRDRLAVRGSKIIQHAYGTHLKELQDLIVRATAPKEPMTIGQVTAEIRQQWPNLLRHEAERIARTETAFLWGRTSWYAMRANGVEEVLWLIATGPAIGTRTADVCELCLGYKEGSPYRMDDLDVIPPVHPNCRCDLAAKLSPTWLPPAQPWTGDEYPPTGIFDDQLPRNVRVSKSRRAVGWAQPGMGWHAQWQPPEET